MLINEVCKKYKLTLRTLRYYEELNLLQPKRNVSNIRDYSNSDIITLELILLLKNFNFTLKDIKNLIVTDDLALFRSLLKTKLTKLDYQHQEIIQKRQIIQSILNTYGSLDTSKHSLSEFVKEQIYIKDTERILPMLSSTDDIKIIISKELIPCASSDNPKSLIPSIKSLRKSLQTELNINLYLVRIVDDLQLNPYEYKIIQNESLLIQKTIDSEDIFIQSDHIISNLKALVI
jgi:DNA-binding transcriptional MerR regulator